ALGAAAPHVAHREDAGKARFEQMWRPAQRPLRGRKVVGSQRRARLDESFVIERQTAGEPLCTRLGAGHGEHVPDFLFLHGSTATGAPGDLLEMPVAFETPDLRASV